MSIDNLERAAEHQLLKKLYSNDSADCCTTPGCGLLIDSERQNKHKGTQVCGKCAGVDLEKDER